MSESVSKIEIGLVNAEARLEHEYEIGIISFEQYKEELIDIFRARRELKELKLMEFKSELARIGNKLSDESKTKVVDWTPYDALFLKILCLEAELKARS